MGQVAERIVVSAVVLQQRFAGIHVDGRAHTGSEIGEGHLLAVQVVLRIGKHCGCRGKFQYGTHARFSAAI